MKSVEKKKEDQVNVWFVIPEGKTELTVSESLSQAFQKSLDYGLAPIWKKEMDTVRLKPTKTVRSLLNTDL